MSEEPKRPRGDGSDPAEARRSERGQLPFEVEIPIGYRLSRPGREEPRELVLALHGYQERSERILRQIEPALPPAAVCLAPDGPFPVPILGRDGYKEAYAWYFYDMKSQEFRIGPEPALAIILRLVAALDLGHLPVRIVGFSQGGYFAPMVARELKGAKQAIGIACGFPERYFRMEPSRFRLDAIVGAEDKIARPEAVRPEFETLKARGWRGELVVVPGAEHWIGPEIQTELRRLLAPAL